MTPRQAQLLEYLRANITHAGVVPSYDEMKDALGLKSKSGIHRLIAGLEMRGLIGRIPGCARAIYITDEKREPAPTVASAERASYRKGYEDGYGAAIKSSDFNSARAAQ